MFIVSACVEWRLTQMIFELFDPQYITLLYIIDIIIIIVSVLS